MRCDNLQNGIVKFLWLFCLCLVGGCTTSTDNTLPPGVQKLTVSFVDPVWDGKRIPAGQQCKAYGGIGAATPRLIIKDIPSGANVLIMEYSDRDYPPMDNGGHGVIGFQLSRAVKEITTPSIPEAARILPPGFFLVSPMSTPYAAPCSGGMGNHYYVTIKAVHESSQGKEPKLLAQSVLDLGVY